MKVLVTGGSGFIGGSVVRNLLERGIPVVIGEYARDEAVLANLKGAEFELMDVADAKSVKGVFARRPDLTHCIHLAYLMSAEVEADMARGVNVNLLGMVNMFEAVARHKLARLVFTSSETVFGASQEVYGDRPVAEDDFCGPNDHFFTYGVMKILDEFMAQKYVARHRVSIACTRPAVVFGHGRKRGSVLWAEPSQPSRRSDGWRSCHFPDIARHLDLQGRLRRATHSPRAQALARALRLQQRRRQRDGRGAGVGRALLAAGGAIRLRRNEADDAADRLAGWNAPRDGNRI